MERDVFMLGKDAERRNTMSHTTDYIGQYDPETLEHVCVEHEDMRQALESAFGYDLLLTMTSEAILGGDEMKVHSDRYGRCLSQPWVVKVVLFN